MTEAKYSIMLVPVVVRLRLMRGPPHPSSAQASACKNPTQHLELGSPYYACDLVSSMCEYPSNSQKKEEADGDHPACATATRLGSQCSLR